MNPIDIFDNYYPPFTALRHMVITHSASVARKSFSIATKHPELKLDEDFLFEAAMLHDIGIFLTYAPEIHCFGNKPYICHGYLGAELLKKEGYPRHALVCERHTGAGISRQEIQRLELPIPDRDMIPVSMEEQVICFADKFFSKTKLGEEKSMEKVLSSIRKHGEEGVERFDRWRGMFM